MMKNVQEEIKHIFEEEADRIFLIDALSGREMTFGELHEIASRVANEMKMQGIFHGDRVAILLPNSLECAILYFACIFCDAVAVPINPVLLPEEVDYILSNCEARRIYYSNETTPAINKAILERYGENAIRASIRKDSVDKPNLQNEWDMFSLPVTKIGYKASHYNEDTVMAIVYTSGTTDKPKGVVIRRDGMLGNALEFCKEMNIDKECRFYGILSMSYLGGYYNLLMLPFMARSSVVIGPTFSAELALSFWDFPVKFKVNTLWLVPTILAILLRTDRGTTGQVFCKENVKSCLVGTAPLSKNLKEEFEKKYSVTLYENYGLSETFFLATNSPNYQSIEGSVGQLLPSISLSIRSDEGNPLGYGKEGRIFVRTPYIMKEYWKNEEEQILDESTWFDTGDIGIRIPTGELFITGRKKDLIIRGGINISPRSIEEVLERHPEIKRAEIVGVAHSVYGEAVVAVVELRKQGSLKEIESNLGNYCKIHLNPLKRPSQFLEITDFPLGSTGKVLKRRLREIVMDKLNIKEVEIVKPTIKGVEIKKTPMLPGRIRKNIIRPDSDVVTAIRSFPTSIISDCLNRMNVADAIIRPMGSSTEFCGPAFTVEEVEGGNLMSHLALTLAQPGDVLVIDAKGTTTRSCWGGLQTLNAKLIGIEAVVINGAIRDKDTLDKYKLPVFAIGSSPGGPMKYWGGYINRPVSLPGVAIAPGDIVRGDADGIVVIPLGLLKELIPLCEERVRIETKWFEMVNDGQSTMMVVGLSNRLDEFDIDI